MAASMGLEIDLEVKGPKIMAEAAGLKSLIDEEPQLLPAKTWNDARAAAIETIGKLKGVEKAEGTSYLYALAFVIDQSKPNLTDAQLVEELKTLCLRFNDSLDKFPRLEEDLYNIVSSEDPVEISEKVKEIITVAPPGITGILQSVIPFVSMTAILSFQTYRRFDKIRISWEGLAGGPVPQGMETRWRRTMTNIDKVQSAVGAIIGIFGATMSIWQAVKSSEAKGATLGSLAEGRDAVKKFYLEVIENVR
jgi:energy-converting hydrogenase Eha subunit A